MTRSKSRKNKEASCVKFANDDEKSNSDDDEDIIDDKKLDNIGAYYMRLGYNDQRIFENMDNNYKVDNEPLSMFVVELPVSEHFRLDVIEAKRKEIDNLITYGTFEEVSEEDVENTEKVENII